MRQILCCWLLVVCGPAWAQGAGVAPIESAGALFAEGLFDPAGARHVRARVRRRGPDGAAVELSMVGWIAPERPGWLVGYSLHEFPVVGEVEEVPFVAAARELAGGGVASWDPGPPTLIAGAWAARLGEVELARMLWAEWGGSDPVAAVADQLGWQAYDRALNAYIVSEDEAAWEILGVFAEEEFGGRYRGEGVALREDLGARRAGGDFGWVLGEELPEGLHEAVRALRDVAVRPQEGSGELRVEEDRLVRRLVGWGEAAVPALLEAVEHGGAYTRTLSYWRVFEPSRRLLTVSEVALPALRLILGLEDVPLALRVGTEAQRARTASWLRGFVERTGHLPGPERWRHVLLDPEADLLLLRAAAARLARHDREELEGLGSPSAATAVSIALDRDLARLDAGAIEVGFQPGPSVGRGVTVAAVSSVGPAAEVGLEEGDRLVGLEGEELLDWHDLAERLRRGYAPGDGARLEVVRGEEVFEVRLVLGVLALDPEAMAARRHDVLAHYLGVLVALGDPQVLGSLRRRGRAAADWTERRLWAEACAGLGDPEPLGRLVRELAEGGEAELTPSALGALLEVALAADPEAADALLVALAGGAHPLHGVAQRLVQTLGEPTLQPPRWSAHPWVVEVLCEGLGDRSPLGRWWVVQDGQLYVEDESGHVERRPWPEVEAERLVARAPVRRCDHAAHQLSRRVLGLPRFHPSLVERDEVRAALIGDMARLGPRLRRARPVELQALGLDPRSVWFVPDWPMRVEGATEEEARSGRALFACGGTPLELALPASAVRRGGGRVLIVQAEQTPGGVARYGVIGPHHVAVVASQELEEIAALPDPEGQRRAALALRAAVRAENLEAVRASLAPETLEMLEAWDMLGDFVGQLEALAREEEEVWLERFAPDFHRGADGTWRLEVN